MTAIGPYTQSMNFTHMTHMRDLIGPLPKPLYYSDTLMGVIQSSPDMKRFCYVVKLAKMDKILNDKSSINSSFTLFVPLDKYTNHIKESVFTDMDIVTAQNIVKNSMIQGKLPFEILLSNPANIYPTENRSKRLFINNDGGKIKVECDRTVLNPDMHFCSNGIIHGIDGYIVY